MSQHRRSSPTARPLNHLLFAALLCAVVPAQSSAQHIRGSVIDAGTGGPVTGFAAMLLDAAGATVAIATARDDGHFTLQAPAAGTFRVRVQRIGYRRTQSAPLILAVGETQDLTVRLPRVLTSLSGVRVDDRQRCEVIPADGAGVVASAWDEARNAFQLVVATGARPNLRVMVRDHVRELAPRGDSVMRETSMEREGRSVMPYASPSPDSIAAFGYVRQLGTLTWFYAPDAGVLLSDVFLREHCFRLQRSRARDDSLIGVAFAPLRTRRQPDIEGVVWLDRVTSEVRSLDFTYTGLPAAARTGAFGGHVAYEHVREGAWLIREWQVRAPIIGMVESRRMTGAGLGASGVIRTALVVDTLLTGIREEGGDVLAARSASGAVLWVAAYGSIQGRLLDSATHAPIANGEVELRGTVHVTRSDSGGGFRLDSVPPGDYTMTVRAPVPGTPPLIRSMGLRVSGLAEHPELLLPVSSVSREAIQRSQAESAGRCAALRAVREREIDEAWRMPISQWHPAGRDSLSIARAVLGAATVLQGIADTSGTVPAAAVRAIRHGPASVYEAAMQAIVKLAPAADEPLPGCKLRRVIVMPYRVGRE